MDPRNKKKKKHVLMSGKSTKKKTMSTVIKQDFIPDLNPLDYAKWSVFDNKTNASYHPNIGLLKTSTGEKWNEM